MAQAGGSRIVFSSNRDGQAQIYLMNADGTGQVRLTNSGGNDDSPRWSPNGTKILFQSDRDNPSTGYNDIYVMNSDGTGQTRLTTDPNDDSSASWSPDGTKIVFQSIRNGQFYQVYVMHSDGTGQLNLSNSAGSDGQPTWSPDGSKIAFSSERDHDGFASIYVMNSDGTNQRRLTFSADDVTDEQPVWSRDGSEIAFVSTRDGNKEVYVMNADGTGQTRLTSDPGNDDSPYWSPDGSKIVFRSDRQRDCCDPTSQVWVMNADGTGQANLSANQAGDYSASWTTGGGNQPPVANAGGSYSGITGQNTTFNGSSSFDPDGSIASYSWSFGDGGAASGISPTHVYVSPGTYTVTLTVTDNLGAQGSATATVSISSSSSDQFVSNFLQWGLARQPTGQEGSYWDDILRAAYPQGQTSMLLAMREFGMTVFESAEYAARNRSDHWYVYDLYKTYLMRDPDASGWAWWEAQVPSMGREQVRHAFDESDEFHQIVATLTASGTPSPAVSSLASARVDPFNQTGDQIQARDCEWGVTLLSLPGRAGLDLGLGLSYSSLVWTRSGPYAYFDEDRGSPSPGFRIGFATIQGPFFDAQTARNVYILVTSSGRRTELRQVGTTSTYEAGDSSYLQLTAGGNSLLLRSTDGTQVSYSPSVAQEWRATGIEDRNGNYLSVGYAWWGDIQSVTDTLGRAVSFNYDANENLQTITQTWTVNGTSQMHTWASFGWGTQVLQPGFSSVAAVGTYAGEVIPVLNQVGLDDGSRYSFEYTVAGQVSAVHRYSFDNVERSRTAYDYATLADDCPRIIATRVRADNWTGINGVPAEVVTQFGVESDGAHSVTTPDETVYKEYYGAGWQRGLVTQEVAESGGAEQRLSVTTWDQDNTGVTYQTNPRVKEIDITDFLDGAPHNLRRTTVDYGQYVQYGLPHLVTEYDSDGARELRRTYTDYNLSQTYLDHRIIGLPSARMVVDGPTGSIVSREAYQYDWQGGDGWGDTYFSAQAPLTGYADPGYVIGRGNLSAVRRYDCTNNTTAYDDTRAAWVSLNGYDMAGSLVWTKDAGSPRPSDGVIVPHRAGFSYADSYSDGNNSRNTLAYPTTVTDGDGFSSTVQYNFDFGAKTRFQGPPPANQPNGIIQTFAYDGAARLQQATTANTGAYVRYIYGPNYIATFSTVNTVADEAYTNTVFDGAGRTIIAASNNPGGGGPYKAQSTQYNLLGRATKQSNPAEVDSSWNPTGPDDGAGWLYTQQTYDWKGRPLLTTNTDGTEKSASYDGCGCAGGQVLTLTDEAGRQQKLYSDALGRQWKTEILNWDGTVYSTTESILNARDQATFVRRYKGTDQGGVFQETANTYDGYGRLQSTHAPAQDAGKSTSYAYNADDTPASVTDARGAVITYSYNDNRHLVTGISYTAPAGVASAPPVSFGYDAAGNRTLMTDGFGHVDYAYDSLSRLTSETRTFSDPNNSSISGVTKALTYDYNLAGELKFVRDPFGTQIDYHYDAAGRLTDVTPDTPSASLSSYASNMQYRAWGAIKGLTYGNSKTLSLGYNSRMQVTSYDIPGIASRQYRYTTTPTSNDNDGRAKFVQDMTQQNSPFDRSYAFDHAGRLVSAQTGAAARGANFVDGPYSEINDYDEWDQTTSLRRSYWSNDPTLSNLLTSSNESVGARTPLWGYDADGRVVANDANQTFGYDAAGREVSASSQVTMPSGAVVTQTASRAYDGDGLKAQDGGNGFATYYLRSTVLGGAVVTELTSAGQKTQTYVYAGRGLLAAQSGNGVTWRHQAPLDITEWDTDSSGVVQGGAELDPEGADYGAPPPQGGTPDVQPMQSRFGDPLTPSSVLIDGMSASTLQVGILLFSAEARGGLPGALGGSSANLFHPVASTANTTWTDNWVDSVNNLPYTFTGPDGQTYTDYGNTVSTNEGYFTSVLGTDAAGGQQNPTEPWVDPKTVGEPPPLRTPLKPKEIYTLRRNMKDMLENPVCSNFIKGILEEFGKLPNGVYSTDIMKIFDSVRGESKGGLFRDFSQAGSSFAYAFGSLERGNATIAFGTTIEAGSGLHETMHVAANTDYNYSHQEMAQAAITSAQAMGIRVIGSLPNRADYPTWKAWDDANSMFFERIFFDACVKGWKK